MLKKMGMRLRLSWLISPKQIKMGIVKVREEKNDQEETSIASEWAKLDEIDNLSTEEFIAYMANLDASSQKVLVNLMLGHLK